VNVVGKLDEGNLHVQFDEGALETGLRDGLRHWHRAQAASNSDSPFLRQPRQCSTLLLLGLTGSKREAEAIKHELSVFLRNELHMELNEEKTLVTHAHDDCARFLGYEVRVLHENSKHDFRRRRCSNGSIGLRVPTHVLYAKWSRYMRRGKPNPLPQRTLDDAYSSVAQYQAEWRGMVPY
jgi:hypothetical protein